MVQRDGAVLDAGGYARFSAERSSGLRLGAVPATSRAFPGPVDRLAEGPLAVAHELADLADAVPSARRLRAVTFCSARVFPIHHSVMHRSVGKPPSTGFIRMPYMLGM